MADRSASMIDLKALRVPSGHYDVAVLGGGLAGLSMALQLMRERPDTRVLVTDKRLEPAPEAAFKVGESSVENGAHYYREVVGLRDHLEEKQLRKLGLRFYLPAGDNSDITKRVEFCTPAHLDAFTHQIDRGRFENELFRRCLKAGADAFRGWRVQEIEMGAEKHEINLSQEDETTTVTARWIVDASGRANLLRRKLDLGTDTGHHSNAVWFRLEGGLDFEDWTDDQEWLDRMPERGLRRLSTTHLIAPGYWLWLIQLASGPISIGVCADPRFHPFEEINTFEGFLDWMRRNEPQLAAEVEGRQEDVLDFLRVEDFSYASSRVFSGKDRWTLVGEAAGFIDALYSPGSDFIAYTNTMSSELIKADLDGAEDIEELGDFYNDFFFRLFNPTIELYRDQYQLFGNPQVMVCKVVTDSWAYFCLLASPFCHGKMRSREDIERLLEVVDEYVPLLRRLQPFYRDWNALDNRQSEGVSALSKELEPYITAQGHLAAPADGDEVLERARADLDKLKAFAVWVFHKAAKHLPDPPDESARINPLAISLQPDQWEADGLFSDDGMTLAEAIEQLPGVEEMDIEARAAATTA
jgi:flavin-dependent dehydrogenase